MNEYLRMGFSDMSSSECKKLNCMGKSAKNVKEFLTFLRYFAGVFLVADPSHRNMQVALLCVCFSKQLDCRNPNNHFAKTRGIKMKKGESDIARRRVLPISIAPFTPNDGDHHRKILCSRSPSLCVNRP